MENLFLNNMRFVDYTHTNHLYGVGWKYMKYESHDNKSRLIGLRSRYGSFRFYKNKHYKSKIMTYLLVNTTDKDLNSTNPYNWPTLGYLVPQPNLAVGETIINKDMTVDVFGDIFTDNNQVGPILNVNLFNAIAFLVYHNRLCRHS